MRYGNPDRNQPKIVEDLRDIGATVKILTGVGDDFPDIIVGWQGENFLFEIKSAKGELSKGQKKFRAEWRGQVDKAKTLGDILKVLGIRGY